LKHAAGYGTIQYRPDDVSRPDVHGVILELSNKEMDFLDTIEGGYDLREVSVSTSDGEVYQAKAFISNWSTTLFDETRPTKDYITKIRDGALANGLPQEYQARKP
jgi:gamma-glutamylcyclotransferase (GGCT)/AIG2-like uncharacterized protein YtfP